MDEIFYTDFDIKSGETSDFLWIYDQFTTTG